MLISHFLSFACATFISTVATINTEFVPDDRTTIGVYAAVLISQGGSGIEPYGSPAKRMRM